jgi:hypothetical protein
MVVENGFSGTRNVQETDEGQKFSNWVEKKIKNWLRGDRAGGRRWS